MFQQNIVKEKPKGMVLSLSLFGFYLFLYLKMSPKTVLTNGPIKKIWLKNAMEKFSTKVWSNTETTSMPGFLNSRVAIRLMAGHIRHTIMEESASTNHFGFLSADR